MLIRHSLLDVSKILLHLANVISILSEGKSTILRDGQSVLSI